MSTHVCIQKYGLTGPCHIRVQQNRLTSLIKMVHTSIIQSGGLQGTPRYSSLRGRWWPTSTRPGGGRGTSTGPPCPGGRRPLVIAASTAARRRSDRHGCGNPTHCSRTSSSWIWIHRRSGTPRRTASKRRAMSSSTPAAAGGACDDPAPGSSQRRL